MASWQRLDIYERDGFRCRYCGFDGSSFEAWPFLIVDHINPRGPRDDPANLATCCRRCNDWKGPTPCESVEQAKDIITQAGKLNREFWEQNVAYSR
jgi:5-methylcytosine-specific restriction endonuclease McrA